MMMNTQFLKWPIDIRVRRRKVTGGTIKDRLCISGQNKPNQNGIVDMLIRVYKQY